METTDDPPPLNFSAQAVFPKVDAMVSHKTHNLPLCKEKMAVGNGEQITFAAKCY